MPPRRRGRGPTQLILRSVDSAALTRTRIDDLYGGVVPKPFARPGGGHRRQRLVAAPCHFPYIGVRGAHLTHAVRGKLIHPRTAPAIALVPCLDARHPGWQAFGRLLARHRALSAGDIGAMAR